MRSIAAAAVRDLGLDYAITMISGGAGRKYEIVMWDKPRNSYFSVRLQWQEGASAEAVTEQIKAQIRERLAALELCDVYPDDRRPFRKRRPQTNSGAQVA